MRRRDEEMQRRDAGGKGGGSRKLSDQLTGSVETKLAGGIKGDGRRGREGGDEWRG